MFPLTASTREQGSARMATKTTLLLRAWGDPVACVAAGVGALMPMVDARIAKEVMGPVLTETGPWPNEWCSPLSRGLVFEARRVRDKAVELPTLPTTVDRRAGSKAKAEGSKFVSLTG